MASITDLPGTGTAAPGAADAALLNWINAALRSVVATLNSEDVTGPANYVMTTAGAGTLATEIKALIKTWNKLTSTPGLMEKTITGTPYAMVAWIIQKVTGLTISGGQVENWANGPDVKTQRSDLGKILTDMYGETLKTDEAAKGWLNREPGTAEWENFRQLSGAAMRIQVGDLIIGWLGKGIPYGIGSALGDIAEKINDAIALDDAIEEVVQVPMQAVIQRGLEADYNRKLKPVDFTASEALQARIAGVIDEATLTKILDNLGYRLDMREQMRNSAATNLTESDINDLYQHNLFDREQVKDQYRQKYFEEDDRELKTKLVEGTRRWKLEEKANELYGNLYRDGVATKEEIRPRLNHFGYDPDEQDLWFEIQELERRQRRWLTKSEVHKLVGANKWTNQFAIDYIVMQGMTVDDATYIFVEDQKEEVAAEAQKVIKALPKAVKDQCDDLLNPETILKELLAKALALVPLGLGSNAQLVKIIECALEHLGLPTP